jgi:hypothetical protein
VETGGECAFSEKGGSNSGNWAAEQAADAGNGVPTPAPIPPPCNADASGYCAAGGPLTVLSSVTCMVQGPHGKVPLTISTSTAQAFIVYLATDLVESATKFTHMSNAACNPLPSGLTTTWSPAEPSAKYGDPNLP